LLLILQQKRKKDLRTLPWPSITALYHTLPGKFMNEKHLSPLRMYWSLIAIKENIDVFRCIPSIGQVVTCPEVEVLFV